MSTLKETAIHSAIYSLGNLAVKFAGLVMLPIISANLSIGDYGVFGLIESLTQILVGLLSLKLPIAAMRLAGNENNETNQRALFTHSLLILIGVCFVFLGLVSLLANPLSILLSGKEDQFLLVMLVAGSIASEIIGQVPIYYLRFKNKSVAFVSLMLLKLVLLVAMIYFFIEVKQLGIIGLVGSFFAANLLFTVLSLILVYIQPVKYSYSSIEAKSLIRFGFPLIFTSVITILLTTSDRYIIRIFHEFADIGVYSVSIKVASIVTFVIVNSFFLAYTPIAYKKHGESVFRELQPTILTYLMLVSMSTIWFLSLFSEPLLELLTNNLDYVNASEYVPYLGIVIGLAALQNFLSMSFHYANKTSLNIPIVTIALVINIILAFILIPFHAIYGALASSIIAMLVMVVLTYNRGKKVYPDVLGLKLLLKLFTLIVLGAIICVAANQYSFEYALLLKTVLFILMSALAVKLFNINIKQVTITLKGWIGI